MENKKDPADLNSSIPSPKEIQKARHEKTAAELDRRNAHLKMKPRIVGQTADNNNA